LKESNNKDKKTLVLFLDFQRIFSFLPDNQSNTLSAPYLKAKAVSICFL